MTDSFGPDLPPEPASGSDAASRAPGPPAHGSPGTETDGEPRREDLAPAGPPGAGDEAPEPTDTIRVIVVCVLAWALPGLGHVAAGRVARGLVFGVVILSLFIGGVGLDGKVYRPEPGMPLTYLAAVAGAGVGLPYVAAHALGIGVGNLLSATYEYGNTFTLVAGLLNLLVVLDAYDVAAGRR